MLYGFPNKETTTLRTMSNNRIEWSGASEFLVIPARRGNESYVRHTRTGEQKLQLRIAMAFFNKPELKRAAGFPNAATKAISESRRELKGLPFGTEFDIFLSHCFRDLEYVLGLKNMLEEMEYRVYTDWDADSDLNRRAVTSDTAQVLSQRMKDCRCLFYAVSDTSSESKWMPWELGYSDGLHGNVAILPCCR